MSISSWSELLIHSLAHKKNNPARLAILGIGNELNADDAAGVLVARRVRSELSERHGILALEAGPSPENFTGPLRRFRPDLVLLVDAAQMHEPPGAVRWIEWDAVDGMSAATHRLPPTTLASFLMSELGCQVVLLGIQPATLDFDQPVSAEVLTTVDSIALELIQVLTER
jgi:hydrogenase 3 maturation protease